MSRYKFMEFATKSPRNRGRHALTREVIAMPFEKPNRFTEMWRGMYAYETNSPAENEPMFGNFYVECDSVDFDKNRETMLKVSSFLREKHEIPYLYMEYFATNKSIWLSIPAKVMGCYGSKKLNLIHREMAREVQEAIKAEGDPLLDVSIYKWNALIHSLGSYLPKVGGWVSKFSYYDLERAKTIQCLREVKYDNLFTFEDMKEVPSACSWFARSKAKILGETSKKTLLFKTECNSSGPLPDKEASCMVNMTKPGAITLNRNNHVFTYALYLKSRGFSLLQAESAIQKDLDTPYVNLPECTRTIRSAFLGRKRFGCSSAKQYISPELLDCSNCPYKKRTAENIYVPRVMIERLQSKGASANAYKLLICILKTKQVDGREYAADLSKEKHRAQKLEAFNELQEADLISLATDKDTVKVKLKPLCKTQYKSYLLLPKNFTERRFFKKVKNEIITLLELLRASVMKNNTHIFNALKKTVSRKTGFTLQTTIKHMSTMESLKILVGGKILLFSSLAKHVKETAKGKFQAFAAANADRLARIKRDFVKPTGREKFCKLVDSPYFPRTTPSFHYVPSPGTG